MQLSHLQEMHQVVWRLAISGIACIGYQEYYPNFLWIEQVEVEELFQLHTLEGHSQEQESKGEAKQKQQKKRQLEAQ